MSPPGSIEELLEASEARYRSLLDDLPLPTFIYDVETLRYLDANQAAVELYGYSRAEFLAMRVTDIRPPEDVPRLLETFNTLARAPRKLGVWKHRKKDGSVLEMDIVSRDTTEGGRRARLVIASDVTEQRRAQRALAEAKEKLSNAQSLARVGSWEWDPATQDLRWSDELFRMLGLSRDQKPSFDLWVPLLHPEDRDRVLAALDKALRGDPYDLEMRFVLPSGELVAHALGQVREEAGAKVMFGTLQDVTERKIMEREHKVAARAQDAIYRIADAANASGTLEEMLGAVHRIVSELMPAPNFYIALHDPLSQQLEFPYYVDERGDIPTGPEQLGLGLTEYVLRTGQPLALRDRGEFEALASRGEVRQVGVPSASWVGVPLRTKDRTVGVLAVQVYEGPTRYGQRETELLTFVSSQVAGAIERKQADAELRKSEQRFRALIGNLSDGILVTSEAGSVLFQSASVARILGEGAAVEGRSIWDLVHPEDLPRATKSWAEVLASPGVPVTTLARLRHSNGSWRELESVVVNRLGDPAVRGVVSNFRDITDRKLMEARLMMADRMVSVGTLAAGVAHEINNPLAYVMANLDYVADKLGAHDREVSDALSEAQAGAERVRTIVRDLKTFSRGDDLAHGAVDLHRVLEASANMAWNEVRHRARLSRDYAAVLPRVLGNESRLGQVFLNLLINAAQAIPEGEAARHEIRLSTCVEGDRVIVDVRDTGAGIAAEHLTRLFDPFFTTKPIGVGTGLGLFICQNIVTALGGEITVESEPGKGTTMHVALRAAGDPADAGRPRAQPSAAPRARVLVVDDEALLGSALVRSLPEHDITTETSAQAALARLRAGARYDLILCDLMMPEMTGVGFFEQVARDFPEAARSVVFMTGGAFTAAARSFLDGVDNPRLDKPVDLNTIRAILAARLQR